MMKLKVIHIILAFFLVYSSLCTAQKTESAAYTAGFRYYKTYDESRSYILNNDTISRPLLIHFWYPSHEITKTENLHFKDYVDLISLREDFNKASSEVSENSINFIDAYAGFAKQNFGLDTNISTQQILECPVSAQYGIDIAKTDERFPLIIYAPSNGKSAVQNHMICEYLASHGYMVISVGSAGAISLNRKNDQGSIMAQVEDMEYILKYFTDNLNLKYSGLGLFGFSSGGLATTIFQMRNKNVGAVLSMDGSQEYGHYTILSTVGDFNLKKTTVPYCLFVNNYQNFSIYPFYNSIVTRDKYMFRMPFIDHNGFVSYWRFFDLCSSNSNSSQYCSSYDYISGNALAFFNEYLKPPDALASKSNLSFQENEYIRRDTTDHTIVAQLGNVALSCSIDSVLSVLYSNHEIYKGKENELYILSRLIRDSKMNAAIQLLLFNVDMHPKSWQAYYELAYTHKMNGDMILAKKTALKAQQLSPENTEILNLLHEIDKSEK